MAYESHTYDFGASISLRDAPRGGGDNESMSLGDTVGRLLAARKMSKAALGRKLGISGQAVGMWIKGPGLPKPGRLQALADALDVSVADLLGGTARYSETQTDFDGPRASPEYSQLPVVSQAVADLLRSESVAVTQTRLTEWALEVLEIASDRDRRLAFEERLAIGISELRSALQHPTRKRHLRPRPPDTSE